MDEDATMRALNNLYLMLSLIYNVAPRTFTVQGLPSAQEVKAALNEATLLLRSWWVAQWRQEKEQAADEEWMRSELRERIHAVMFSPDDEAPDA